MGVVPYILLVSLAFFLGFSEESQLPEINHSADRNQTHVWVSLNIKYEGEGNYSFQPFNLTFYDIQWQQYERLGKI